MLGTFFQLILATKVRSIVGAGEAHQRLEGRFLLQHHIEISFRGPVLRPVLGGSEQRLFLAAHDHRLGGLELELLIFAAILKA